MSSKNGLKVAWFAAFAFLFVSSAVSAEEFVEEFQLRKTERIASASGMLIPQVSAFELSVSVGAETEPKAARPTLARPAKAVSKGGDAWQVSVQLQDGDTEQYEKISVIVTTSAGRILASPVKWLQPEVGQNLSSARCVESEEVNEFYSVLGKNVDAHQALIKIRETRVGVLQDHLNELLTIETLRKLNRLESELGTSRLEPISNLTPLDELTFRIGAIDAVLRAK